jgi:hypothetical protein
VGVVGGAEGWQATIKRIEKRTRRSREERRIMDKKPP